MNQEDSIYLGETTLPDDVERLRAAYAELPEETDARMNNLLEESRAELAKLRAEREAKQHKAKKS